MALLGGEIVDGDTVRVDVADGGEGLTVRRHDLGEPTAVELDDLNDAAQ
jgi:ATP-dependent Clp protease ATP-binding subunit ClpB